MLSVELSHQPSVIDILPEMDPQKPAQLSVIKAFKVLLKSKIYISCQLLVLKVI